MEAVLVLLGVPFGIPIGYLLVLVMARTHGPA